MAPRLEARQVDIPALPDDERHAGDRVVHRPLLGVAMIGQAVAMVGREDDDRVVEIPAIFERLHDLADLLVDHRDIGKVVGPLPVPLLVGRIQIEDHRVVIDVVIVLAQFLQTRRLRSEFLGCHRQQRQVLLQVRLGSISESDRTADAVRESRSAETAAGAGFVRIHHWPSPTNISECRSSGQVPVERPESLAVVGPLAVLLALLFDQSPGLQSLVPFVKVVALFEVAILVLDYVPFVKSERRVIGIGVHLADVDAVIASVEVLDP